MSVVRCFIWALEKAFRWNVQMKNPVTLSWTQVHVNWRNLKISALRVQPWIPGLHPLEEVNLNWFNEGKPAGLLQGPALVHEVFPLWNEVCSSISCKWAQISIAVWHPNGSSVDSTHWTAIRECWPMLELYKKSSTNCS